MENVKILLVDDEQDILEFVKYNLEREGYLIETANNGKDALETAFNFKPELILLDVMMPEMDGIEVCHKLREKLEYNNTIIAMLTARNEDYTQVADFRQVLMILLKNPLSPEF